MNPILLCRRFWRFNNDIHTNIERIEAEFKTDGLVISQMGKSYIKINKKGQKILYEELKRRFEHGRKSN